MLIDNFSICILKTSISSTFFWSKIVYQFCYTQWNQNVVEMPKLASVDFFCILCVSPNALPGQSADQLTQKSFFSPHHNQTNGSNPRHIAHGWKAENISVLTIVIYIWCGGSCGASIVTLDRTLKDTFGDTCQVKFQHIKNGIGYIFVKNTSS